MRYIGNKTKLLDFIQGVIQKHDIGGTVFVDLFAGTGSVSDFFKSQYAIIANDFMYYSFVFLQAKLKNQSTPKFEIFRKKYSLDIFEWLNNLNFEPNENFFIYNNYTPIGNRQFFTESNGLKIDGIRISIEELYRDKFISESEYFYLLGSLLESTTKFSNTSGTYEAFFKFWESRALKDFSLEPLDLSQNCNQSELNLNHRIYNEDSNVLIRRVEGDILYIDPPYSVTQYSSAYHILETIARYDFPAIKGVGGKRDKGKCVSLYSRKQFALEQFEDLFRQAKFKHILISYSNQSIVPLHELLEMAKIFSVDGKVHVENVQYKEYQNHRSSNKRNGEKLKEVIIYFKKDNQHNKSPLNYSGSKDTMLPEIVKNLPKHIEVFVDAMGGAFNVGANIFSLKKVIYNEINPYVFEIIKILLSSNKNDIVTDIEKIIKKFNLSKGAKEPYYALRNHYNSVKRDPLCLYTLHMYGFQNIIRFNNSQNFNTPLGVAGYSDDIKNRILKFKPKSKKVQLYNQSYTELKFENFPLGTLFYFDPPYFITSAAYNDGKRGLSGWNGDSEVELLSTLTKIHNLGHKFMLSNVLSHNGKTHHLLSEWIEEHGFNIVNIGTSGWRYSKNESIIKNY